MRTKFRLRGICRGCTPRHVAKWQHLSFRVVRFPWRRRLLVPMRTLRGTSWPRPVRGRAQRHFSAFGLREGWGVSSIDDSRRRAARRRLCASASGDSRWSTGAVLRRDDCSAVLWRAPAAPLPLPGPASEANAPPALPANVSPAPAAAVALPAAIVAPAAPAAAAAAAIPQAGGLMLSPVSVVAPVTANVILVASVYDAAQAIRGVPARRLDPHSR